MNPIQTNVQAPLVRLVGVDGGKAPPNIFQYPQLVGTPDTSNQTAQAAQQNVVQGYKTVADLYGGLSQVSGNIAQLRRDTGFGEALVRIGSDISDRQQKAEEQKAKREAAEFKAQQEKNLTGVTLLSQALVSRTLETAKKENPHQAWADAMSAITSADIPEADKQQLIRQVGGSLDGLYKEWDSTQIDIAKKWQNAAASSVESDIQLETVGLRSQLTNPKITAEETRTVLDNIDSTINRYIEKNQLDPMTALELRGRIIKNVGDTAFVGAQARQEIQTRASQYTVASNEINGVLRDKYGGDPSNPDFQAEAGLIATRNGLPSSFRTFNIHDQTKVQLEFERSKEAIGDLTRKRQLDAEQAKNYTLFEYGTRVYAAIKSKDVEARLDKDFDAPVISMLSRWRQDKKEYLNLTEQVLSLNTRIRAASQGKETVSTSVSQTQDPVLGAAQTNTSKTQSKSFTPASPEQVAALVAEQNNKLRQIQALKQDWVPYGLDEFDDPGISFNRAAQRNAAAQATVNEWKKLHPNQGAAGQGGGAASRPNYNSVPRLMDYQGMTLPISPSTKGWHISRTHKKDPQGDRTGHGYPSIDIATPVNTKTYALFPGTVIKASNTDPTGYGLEILVKGANGVTQRVAHMNKSVVRVGDIVRQGDLIGYSGGEVGNPNSGATTGPHIHMDFPNLAGSTDGQRDIYNKDRYLEPRTFLKSIPQQLQRPIRGYGLPESQGMDGANNLSVISLADGGYIKDNIYYSPNGAIHSLSKGTTEKVVPAAIQKTYDTTNTKYGLTAPEIQKYGYTPQAVALPSELQRVGGTDVKLRTPAATAFSRMRAAAAAQGIPLYPISGHRSPKEQESIIADKVRRGMSPQEIMKYSAPVGYSEHHTGDALDLGTDKGSDLNGNFSNTRAYEWLKRNAGRYGFSLSYTDGRDSGTAFEPWHWKYVGTKKSKVADSNVSTARPLKVGAAPIHKSAYKPVSNPDANYGYEQLATDKAYARKLNQVADRLGIPGQWLADIIDYENNTHAPSRWGGAGNAYVGLIQFGEAAAKDLGVSQHRLAAMSRVEQLDYVYKYLAPDKKGFNTIEDVYAAINIGNPYDTPAQRAHSSRDDGNNSFPYHVNRLGFRVGRKYQTSYRNAAPIHTSYSKGCALCTQLVASNGEVPPHYEA